MRISPKLSTGLQVANLFATLLVIAIHYTSKFGAGYPVEITPNFFFQEFFTNNIARVAVPFFAFSSGFFLFLSYTGLPSYKKLLLKRWRTLLLPYLLVSALIYFLLQGKEILSGAGFTAGWYEILYNIVITPKAGQFWFLRDLIILVTLAPLVMFLTSKGKEILLAVVGLFWLFELQFFPILGKWYILNTETIFFFMAGCYFSSRHNLLEQLTLLSRQKIYLIVAVWVLLSLLRVYIDPVFSAWYRYDYTMLSLLLYKLSILSGIVALIAVSSRQVFAQRKIILLSGFTFFAYMFHTEPMLDVIVYFVKRILSPEYVFFLSYPLAAIMVFFGAYICERYFQPLYMLLTGNRGTDRVLARL